MQRQAIPVAHPFRPLGAMLLSAMLLAATAGHGLAAEPAGTAPAAEKRQLCARLLKASGYQAAAEASTRASMRELSRRFRRSDPQHSRAFDAALNETLQTQGRIFEGEANRICADAYAIGELRSIVRFFESPQGRTFVRTSEHVVMPAMEAALEKLQPQMADELLRRYCARTEVCEGAYEAGVG